MNGVTNVTWFEVSEKRFDDMLGALPPQVMRGGGFLLGEASDFNSHGELTYLAFRQRGEIFEQATRPLTLAEFDAAVQEHTDDTD